jgi:hypothetical protein
VLAINEFERTRGLFYMYVHVVFVFCKR